MVWKLLRTVDGQPATTHSLQLGSSVFLALAGAEEGLAIVPTSNEHANQALARIDVGLSGVKLSAVGENDVRVKPGRVRSSSSAINTSPLPVNEYQMIHPEVMILRDFDQVILPKLAIATKFMLTWKDSPEIQVNSSITGDAEIPEEDEETEDEDLDRTTIADVQSNSTPMPSVPRSEIVQETPTAGRVHESTEFDLKSGIRSPPEDTAPQAFSTAPTKPINGTATEDVKGKPHDTEETAQEPLADDAAAENAMIDDASSRASSASAKPQKSIRKSRVSVQIPARGRPNKRHSPDVDLDTIASPSSLGRPTKRLKKEDNQNDGTGKPVAKQKKHGTLDAPETTPKSNRSSQSMGREAGRCEVAKPRVAFSNSGIITGGSIVKFLRKRGGTPVESVKGEKCNILCVKDGTLKKSMKLLLCVACGIPIVTDNWLIESARDDQFLRLEHFKPRVPAQEKEWNFSFDEIWNKPQKTLEGYTIYFTSALKQTYKPFNEVEELCKAAGARRTLSKPGKEVKDKDVADNTILLALDEHDKDAMTIMENGYTCYTRDLLTLGILRGEMDLESDEFKIKPATAEAPKKKGRARKS